MTAARALPALPTLGELLSAARIAVSIHPVARAAIILTALLTPTTLGDDSCRNKACGLANDDGKADGDQGDAEADGSAGGDLSGHAQDRMGQRGVSPDRVKEAQEKAVSSLAIRPEQKCAKFLHLNRPVVAVSR